MALYVLPQVKVFQQFLQTPAAVENPLLAAILGPNYFLQKYAAGEGRLGLYQHMANVSYPWPQRPVGAAVDETFTRVFVKNALLRYYVNVSDVVEAVPGRANQIRANATAFAANGAAYPRSPAFYGRDVRAGDVAHVYANVGGELVELWSRIIGLAADQAAATIGLVGADSGNESDLVAGTDVEEGENNTGGLSIDSVSITGYDGLAAGYAQETYTIRVTFGGENALARVTSKSGTDDAENAVLVRSGQRIGSRGLTFNWTGTGTWDVGDSWEIAVRQNYSPPTITAAGTYDNTADTTYILEVTRGWSSQYAAQISVSTHNGIDISGPHLVTAGTPISIGTRGVTVTFSKEKLIRGERWYLSGTGRKNTYYRTLVLADSLPEALREATPDLNLALYAKKDIQLPRERFPDPPNVNWTQSAAEITLRAGAQVYDSEFVDNDGEYFPLYLENNASGLYGILYVEYRALLSVYANELQTITDISDVEDLLGEISTDNPLALGVWYALRNSNGTPVKFIAVSSNDYAGYSTAVDKLVGRSDVYTLVPLTRDAAVQQMVAGHVDAMSTEINAQWRICFLNGASSSIVPLIAAGRHYPDGGASVYQGEYLTAKITGDPAVLVTWAPSEIPPEGLEGFFGNGGFLAMGVRPGDVFRTNYRPDGFGGQTYSDYIVDEVLDNSHLRLISGPRRPYENVPIAFTVQRSLSRTEEAAAYGSRAGAFDSRRVYYVWPDEIEDAGGVRVPGLYLASAIAGLISGVVPHQGLTNVSVEGFSAATRTTQYFTATQLNTMAGSGVWIVDQDPDTGAIYNRHEVSSCTRDLSCRELMITKNVDSISYVFYNRLRPYIGRANVTDRFLEQLRRQIMATTGYLLSRAVTPELGGQIISAEILNLRQHPINLDQVVVELRLVVPRPVNVIELHLII